MASLVLLDKDDAGHRFTIEKNEMTIGRKPEPAAPIPMPVIAASAIGVTLIRDGPNSFISGGNASVDI